MALVLIILAAIPVLGALYLTIGKSRSVDRLRRQAEEDVCRRLESIMSDVEGRLVEGPALETRAGVLWLIASRAPQSMVIDLAKFTATLATSNSLIVVATPDAGKVPARRLQVVTPDDPGIAAMYQVFASDEAWARSVVNSKLVDKLRDVDRVVRARSRLNLINGTASIHAQRGLAKPEEIKAFYDSCVAVITCLRLHIGG